MMIQRSMGKYLSTAFTFLFLVTASTAFTKFSSSFTGRVTSVCSREELTTELSCPPSHSAQRRAAMSMPPFLKKLGLKKPNNDKEDEETSKSVAVLDPPAGVSEECVNPEDVEEKSETEKLLAQIKEAGLAGGISYAAWELAFWAASVPVCSFGFYKVTGHWPDFQNKEDMEKLGAEAFAFVNFARFAVPLRIGLALSTTPWVDENIVRKFLKKDDPEICEIPEE